MLERWENDYFKQVHKVYSQHFMYIEEKKDFLLGRQAAIYKAARPSITTLSARNSAEIAELKKDSEQQALQLQKALDGIDRLQEINADQQADKMQQLAINAQLQADGIRQQAINTQLQADVVGLTDIVRDQQDIIDRHDVQLKGDRLLLHADFIEATKSGQYFLKMLVAISLERGGKSRVHLSRRDSKLSSRVFKRGVESLVELGFIKVLKVGSYKKNRATLYEILYGKK